MRVPPDPPLPYDLMFDCWCKIGTKAPNTELTKDRYYPYGTAPDGEPNWTPCFVSIEYQGTSNPNILYPGDTSRAIHRMAAIFVPPPAPSEIPRMFCQRGWLIVVYDSKDDVHGTSYICTDQCQIYPQHVEFTAIPRG